MTLSVRLLLDWIFKMRGLWSSYTVSEIASALNMRRENTTLKSLNLSGNKIGDAGVQAIANALRENTTLKKISFGNYLISM